MHYIRLHRCTTTVGLTNPHLYYCKLVFTITTDLGDDFYAPSEPLRLSFRVEESLVGNADGTPVYWKAGMRVMSLQLPIFKPGLFEGPARLYIYATSQPMPGHDQDTANPSLPFWSHGLKKPQFELIIPCHIKLLKNTPQKSSFRTLPLHDGDELLFEEELGESIARHLWDAGVITASYLGSMWDNKEAISRVLPIAIGQKHIKVLELGCGIGVLGITVAGILDQVAFIQGSGRPNTLEVLLTDVDDAEERASSNIAAAIGNFRQKNAGAPPVELAYENLDWDDGKRGKFGPLASQRWDFVILSDCTYNVDSFPALAGTLSAVHAQNCLLAQSVVKTRVLLATKPRHSSEESLFGILEEEGWQHRVAKPIPIIRDNAEDEVVYIYTLEKGTGLPPNSVPTPTPAPTVSSRAKKRKTPGRSIKEEANPAPTPASAPNKRKTPA